MLSAHLPPASLLQDWVLMVSSLRGLQLQAELAQGSNHEGRHKGGKTSAGHSGRSVAAEGLQGRLNEV